MKAQNVRELLVLLSRVGLVTKTGERKMGYTALKALQKAFQ